MNTTANTITTKETPIPVGIDIGSLNARIAFCESPAATASSSSTNLSQLTTATSSSSQPIKPPSIVPNEIGERYTLALATEEPKSGDDPMNDEIWDLDHGKKKNKKDQLKKEDIRHVYGDSARKVLQRLKKPLGPHLIQNSIQCRHENDDETTTNDKNPPALNAAAIGFFSHLTLETTNATHTHPSSLRIVLSLPPDNLQLQKPLTSTAQSGLLQSMRTTGWESHPDLPSNLNKRDKKSWVETYETKRRIAGVITSPLAACHAHSLFDHSDASSWKTGILVLDWGASSLSATTFSTHGAGGSSMMLSQTSTTSNTSVSGTQLSLALMTHVAETFERKHRIPKGDVMLNKKAKAKLEVAATNALRTFGFSPKVQIAIDGLFEGMDCHVEVTLPRFEMICSNWLRGAEAMLKQVVGGRKMDVVLTCGNVIRMPMVKKMMDRLFVGCYRGKSLAEVPPEEAVAMGCAIYANILVSPIGEELSHVVEDEEEKRSEDEYPIEEEHVVLSPIGLGLTLQEQDSAFCVLVEKGTPLPALATNVVDISGLPSNGTLRIVQILGEEEKVVGKVEGFDKNASEVEVTTELSIDGKLRICVDGGPIFEI